MKRKASDTWQDSTGLYRTWGDTQPLPKLDRPEPTPLADLLTGLAGIAVVILIVLLRMATEEQPARPDHFLQPDYVIQLGPLSLPRQ
jgi:hypothetical protein